MAALHSNPGRVGLTIHYWGGSIPVPCTGPSWEHSEDTPELTHPKRKEGGLKEDCDLGMQRVKQTGPAP